MKVGIMSMQRIRNYGSFLQVYGLKKMIENLGHTVEFVDYKVEPTVNIKNVQVKKRPIAYRIVRKICTVIRRNTKKEKNYIAMQRQRFRAYSEYNDKILPLLGINEKKNYRPSLDVLVIGSDEVFNCLQENEDVGYSRELFGKDNNADKLISYAASFGNTSLERLEKYGVKSEVAALLERFDAISVRDSNSGKIVEKLTTKEPHFHLDPVLVSDYSNEEVKEINEKDYIIVYAYSGRLTSKEQKAIKSFAKKENKKLISIQGTHKCCDKYVSGTPFEILAYFKNADYIITDTFHGSIFSIINEKPFVAMIRKTEGDSYGNEEKMSDLLTRLGLNDRIITDFSNLEKMLKEKINYEEVNKIRNSEREKTLEYLAEQLNCK